MKKMKKLTATRLRELFANIESWTRLAPVAGGTLASMHVRMLRELFNRQEVRESSKYYRQSLRLLDKWREALIRHNDQELAVIRYDVKTGCALPGSGGYKAKIATARIRDRVRRSPRMRVATSDGSGRGEEA